MMFLLVSLECQFVSSMTSWSNGESIHLQQLARHEESKALREQVLSEYLGDLTNQRKVGVQKFHKFHRQILHKTWDRIWLDICWPTNASMEHVFREGTPSWCNRGECLTPGLFEKRSPGLIQQFPRKNHDLGCSSWNVPEFSKSRGLILRIFQYMVGHWWKTGQLMSHCRLLWPGRSTKSWGA